MARLITKMVGSREINLEGACALEAAAEEPRAGDPRREEADLRGDWISASISTIYSA